MKADVRATISCTKTSRIKPSRTKTSRTTTGIPLT